MSNNTIPRDIACVSDYSAHAQSNLSSQAWAYIAGGSAEEITLKRNIQQFTGLKLKPRLLSPHKSYDLSTKVLGQELAHPIMLAPVAYQKLAHPDGELATVQAAYAQQTPMIVSNLSSTLIEDIAQKSPLAHLWFQLYVQADMDVTLSLIQRAVKAGYKAIVITVDAPINGLRNREHRCGFTLPSGVSAVNLTGHDTQTNTSISNLMAAAPSWQTLAWLIEHSPLPVLIKGIMSAEDAMRAEQTGASGVIVSNHGGRSLDCLPSTLDVLPAISKAVCDSVSIIVDGGVQRGTDVLAAKAYGADAVLIGRPILYALATAGALGVAHILRLLQDEIELGLALCGCQRFSDFDGQYLYS